MTKKDKKSKKVHIKLYLSKNGQLITKERKDKEALGEKNKVVEVVPETPTAPNNSTSLVTLDGTEIALPELPTNVPEYVSSIPEIDCGGCDLFGTCPEFKLGNPCKFNEIFKKINTQDKKSLKDVSKHLVGLNIQRAFRAIMDERLNGGSIDKRTSSLIKDVLKQLDEDRNPSKPTGSKLTLEEGDDGYVKGSFEGKAGAGKGFISRFFGAAREETVEKVTEEKKVE